MKHILGKLNEEKNSKELKNILDEKTIINNSKIYCSTINNAIINNSIIINSIINSGGVENV